jgi:hypothetical protein
MRLLDLDGHFIRREMGIAGPELGRPMPGWEAHAEQPAPVAERPLKWNIDAQRWMHEETPVIVVPKPRPPEDWPMQWGGFETEFIVTVESFGEAQGVWFLCPKCFAHNGGAKGTHCVWVSFAGRGVPDESGSHNNEGKPSRWTATGTGLHDLTTTPSILLTGGCAWHGWITNGDVTG